MSTVFIVENSQTGYAFPEIPSAVVIMGKGYGVEVLGRVPWITNAKCIYWGDIDTHGFAILNRARNYFPNLVSILMDEKTLMRHKELWVCESKQHTSESFPFLNESEQALYTYLKLQTFGQNVRLEQERIDWNYALNEIIKLFT